MGGFNSIGTVLGGIGQAAQLYKAAQPVRNIYMAKTSLNETYQQAGQNYAAKERDLDEKATLENRRIALEEVEETRKRKDALKRATATRQAAFGGQGIDTADGSGEAVMLGLFRESDEDRKYRQHLNQLKRASLDQEITSSRKRNLLDLQQDYTSARNNFVRSSTNNVDDGIGYLARFNNKKENQDD